MEVVILSDTHMPRMAKKLPRQLKTGLENADLILHAGDWQTVELLEELQEYAPVIGVTGNVDRNELKERLNRKEVMERNGITIGITHGDGKGGTTEKRALTAFQSHPVDMIIFGHSHIPVLKQVNGITLFNPGSPTDKRRQPQFSYGLLQLTENTFHLKHVFYEDKS
ncbi:YfcE family phosphodiesterase [Sediminibacillus dalangtanensis]|uniref:Phosphoesterase n=1 Tax=Sediminibacillus dalangtanensis TaxID=2729421 RepID=A0ABX7VQ01_9BACI|nr:metallophosphoesterase [Sediminibacillus dalangtanensis]QTM98568.1 YfcE family phosphodiesterase [Sediminibacillus dalangtanensis]